MFLHRKNFTSWLLVLVDHNWNPTGLGIAGAMTWPWNILLVRAITHWRSQLNVLWGGRVHIKRWVAGLVFLRVHSQCYCPHMLCSPATTKWTVFLETFLPWSQQIMGWNLWICEPNYLSSFKLQVLGILYLLYQCQKC